MRNEMAEKVKWLLIGAGVGSGGLHTFSIRSVV